ncbi:6-phosphogluconate dehydrogenase, NAD(+)-dependent, decarboxylating [Pseudodesulfovibrio profundus]|uniref:6-phosphogluconate dehydrogenase, NAD(+)-dependent, decarboxylating n=1 Tax=Pseudodesulfovibrio profundus TaxID=57320 RepID=A0A2C8FA22_9BACT|nr:decarboxylating 6-phosphogluconate dehydrogenase [Pseudodesulfovibrio profundus]MBC16098.1 6-phosphogluconate dehydrogenase (decarboxylating) [Desulfovibrio sp.]SOB59281.1 6-phosphogluconate dehydrogenase, NAD(+)-dependent, decarboxylating [Pseudodesulfovibrio profundus]
MRIGMVGLGRMGLNMARRLMQHDIDVVGYNRSADAVETLIEEGGTGVHSLAEVVENLEPPRTVWCMLPAGEATRSTIEALADLLSPGDTIIEGGNSYYKDDIRHGEFLAEKDIQYLDAGVSGGIWGLEIGYCTMVGGPTDAFRRLEPIFKALAPKEGYLHCGPVGSGHFIKMIHNGIEYGMMQAYAEGFALIEDSDFGENIDFAELSHLWNQGSVIRSWLLELAGDAFEKNSRLDDIEGYVEDSGEGRWTVMQAIETSTPAPVLTSALMERFASRRPNDFRNRVLAALRREFGGHAVKTSEE